VPRHSQDIDLLHPDAELAAAVAELRRVADIGGLDPFTFTVGEPTSMLGGVAGATGRITVSLGAAVLDRFPLDLSTGLEPVAGLERHQLQPMVEMEDVAALPEVTLYPLPDQIADKVAAMVERHGPRGRASTRYRDLVDLVLIVRSCEVDAELTRAALSAQAHRRELTLPLTLSAPSPAWVSGYRDAVGDAALPARRVAHLGRGTVRRRGRVCERTAGGHRHPRNLGSRRATLARVTPMVMAPPCRGAVSGTGAGAGYDPAGRCGEAGCGVAAGRSPAPGAPTNLTSPTTTAHRFPTCPLRVVVSVSASSAARASRLR